METSHQLKQDQLNELKKVLHDEEWTDTGLSTGNDKVDDECKGLDEYIKKANETATEEDEEIKEHIKEVEDAKEKMNSHPCPCVWGPWSDWTECSKTCEAGSRHRERQIEKEAVNNGTECTGEELEEEVCNDICCRKSPVAICSFLNKRLVWLCERDSVPVKKLASHHEALDSTHCCLELQQLLCFSC